MFKSSSFRRHAEVWQRQWRESQSGSVLKRLMVWLMLGILMVMSLVVLIFLLLLSWLLIPIMIYLGRRAMKKSAVDLNQAQQAHSHKQDHFTIEGEVIKKED